MCIKNFKPYKSSTMPSADHQFSGWLHWEDWREQVRQQGEHSLDGPTGYKLHFSYFLIGVLNYFLVQCQWHFNSSGFSTDLKHLQEHSTSQTISSRWRLWVLSSVLPSPLLWPSPSMMTAQIVSTIARLSRRSNMSRNTRTSATMSIGRCAQNWYAFASANMQECECVLYLFLQ